MLSPTLKQRFESYQDILRFVVALLAADLVWKYLIIGDQVCFDIFAGYVAEQVYTMLTWVRDTVHINGSHIFFDSGNGTHIIWSCAPAKQGFIWLCLILAARGPWVHKLWFIPAGWVLIYGINLIRIFAIALIIEHHPELFEMMHNYIFKYAFYGCMFLMWLVWTNCLNLHMCCYEKG